MEIGTYVSEIQGPTELRRLREVGVSTLFGRASKKLASIASREGIRYYCVDWVFKLPSSGSTRKVLRDYLGNDRRWAGGTSGCPANRRLVEVAARRMIRTLASSEFDGLMLDGIRFPSFVEGLSTFLTCFCSNCLREADRCGIDLESIRRSIPSILKHLTRETNALSLVQNFLTAIDSLRKVRSSIITTVVETFRDRVDASCPGKELGAFIFSPSIARSVGQDYEQLGGLLDLVSPMLYTSGTGAACINAEIAGLARMLAAIKPNITQSEILAACYGQLGIHGRDLPLNPQALRRNGLPAWVVKSEIQSARSKLVKVSRLVPILMLSDQPARSRIETAHARRAEADGVAFFQLNPNRMNCLEQAIHAWTRTG